MNVGRQAARGALWVAASSWINRLTGVVVLAILAVELAPRDLGLLAVAGLASNVLLVLNDLGFGDAVVFFGGDVHDAAEAALFVSILASAALALLLLVSATLIAGFFRVPEAASILRAYSFMVFINGFGEAGRGMLTKDLAFARRFVPEAVPGLAAGAVTTVLALEGAGVWSLVVGDAAREALSTILAFAVLPWRPFPRWHPEVARELWAYARGSLVSSLLGFALQNADYALVGRLLGPVALGYYNLAFRVAILPFVSVTLVVAGVSFPAFVKLLPDRARTEAAFRSTFRVAIGGAFLLGGGVIALAPALQILGPKWAPAVTVARLLGAYVCLRSAAHMVTPLLQATGHPGTIARLRAGWLGLLAGTILVVGRNGIAAVGIAQVAVAGVLLVGHAYEARARAGVDVGAMATDLLRPSAAVALGGGAVLLARHALSLGADTSVGPLLVLGGIFTAVYLAVWLLGASAVPDDLRTLRSRLI